MINSMTGFGQAASTADGIDYTVEIRTVNNRYLKTILRVADIADFLSDEIEKLLKKNLSRGTVNYSLRMKNVSGQTLFDVDEKALQGYVTKLLGVARANEINCHIGLADFLALPGVVQPAVPDEQQAEKMRQVILTLTEQAVDRLKQMRSEEGEALAADLLANCEAMKEKLELIRDHCADVIKQYHEKLRQRADDLLAGAQLKMDEDLLAREVAIFADRSDIAEELARLDSHLQMFTQFCKGDQNGGRKLDFISQEMLREANTIASKAASAQISQWVIDIKCAIDRIKEQIQNVE